MNNMNDFKQTEILVSDFELVQANERIHDKKLETKPTTFLKDALRRFAKNKSSVAGAFILGFLVLLAFLVPILSPYDIDTIKKSEQFLAPKLFEVGTGFWDGTRTYEHIVYDTVNETPAGYYKPAVYEITIDPTPTYIEQANEFGMGGYVMFVDQTNSTTSENAYLRSYPTKMTSTDDYQVKIVFSDEQNVSEGKLAKYRLDLIYTEDGTEKRIELKDWSYDYSELIIDLSAALQSKGLDSRDNCSLNFELDSQEGYSSYLLIESCEFTADETVTNYDVLVNNVSFTDATRMVLIPNKNANGESIVDSGYWSCSGRKGVHLSEIYYCDFVYDTYAKAYDQQDAIVYAASDFNKLVEQGLCKYEDGVFTKLSDDCPIEDVVSVEYNPIIHTKVSSYLCTAYRYRSMGYDNMPKFIFGTDVNGHDIFKRAFSGLRTSLVLGICTAAFCLLFGLCWGAISGYFGGNVDLFMERFCDILAGVPWIVVMTLAILHLGNNFVTFFLALCMTGWMGTAARTRTQFYRFKGREYVLASRTLGSSDMRLIFKHILPNAIGTIITGSVLMIPSVIFSEATLAYLNLGLQGVHSFGVMMAENQQYLSTYPNLVVFPAIVIALMMISFNLFGNGLRDAVNPSLKGTD